MWRPAKPLECKYWHKHLKGNSEEWKGRRRKGARREELQEELLLATTDTNIVSVKEALKQDLLRVRVGHIEHTQKGSAKKGKRTYKQQGMMGRVRESEGARER